MVAMIMQFMSLCLYQHFFVKLWNNLENASTQPELRTRVLVSSYFFTDYYSEILEDKIEPIFPIY